MRTSWFVLLNLLACAGSRAPAASSAPGPLAARAESAPAPKALSPADIALRALPAIVTIRTENSLGTGFILRSDGWIATNLHVIVGGPHLKVALRGDHELDVVEVLAASTQHDLALVRVEARGLPVLVLGDSDAMRPGDAIVAIGNPLGLEDTVSNGLVSARRKIDDDNEVLQISAPIAAGSSGGPIFNDRGEVIGIATAVLLEGQNLNFGMPSRYLLPMMKDPKPLSINEFAKLLTPSRDAAAAKVHRKHVTYPLATLDGCGLEAQKLIFRKLGEAIETGAPLYNAGNPDGCYHVYDGTASDVVRKLPPSCGGPARALTEAQKRAASLSDSTSQAWAMRDAFDALLEIIARKHQP